MTSGAIKSFTALMLWDLKIIGNSTNLDYLERKEILPLAMDNRLESQRVNLGNYALIHQFNVTAWIPSGVSRMQTMLRLNCRYLYSYILKLIELQRAKKVMFDSRRLVYFSIGLVNSVFNLPDRQVMFFEEFE